MKEPIMYKATCPECGDTVWMTDREMFLARIEENPEGRIGICEVCEAQIPSDVFEEVPMDQYDEWVAKLTA